MTFMYDVTWRTRLEADDPRDACTKAKAELQVLLDSAAPIAFDWSSYEKGFLQARAFTVLMPDGSIHSDTGHRR